MQLRFLVSYMVLISGFSGCLLGFCTVCSAEARTPVKPGHSFSGYSHHYGDRFHGRRTASGQMHDKFKLTAAHRSLPFGTHIKVTNTQNGKSCVVVVNDRGPFGSESLVLDVSKAAAHQLGFPGGGKIPIDCRVIDPKEGASAIAKNIESAPSLAKDPRGDEKELSRSVAVKPKEDALSSKPLEKTFVVTSPTTALVVAKPKAPQPSKTIASISTPPKTKEDYATTFLLVINEALEVDPTQNCSSVEEPKHEPSPNVFVQVEDRQSKEKTGAVRSIADRPENPLL